MIDFKLSEYTRKSNALLDKAKHIFNEYQDLDLKGLDINSLPVTMQAQDGPVKLVFVGQYSSGKSSIIKMLSGIDTEIGASIKTQEAHAYKWGDLEIIDTPGIHTELRPDHDEKTYYQINHAALLIFCVTNEGFDDRMGNHFRKLAIEQDRAKNMVLVVNKMDRTALGNVPEQQKIIENDLLKVIEPYTPQDLYLSFTDTESYFAGKEETDAEMKTIYEEQSGYQAFVEHLNAFVDSRGVLSKIQAPLETLKSSVTNIIGDPDNFNSDEDIDAMEELIKRKKRALSEGKRNMDVEVRELAHTCGDKIRAEGARVAGMIAPGVTKEDVERRLEVAQSQSEIYIQECENQILSRLSDIIDDINADTVGIENSKFAMTVQNNVTNKLMRNIAGIQSSVNYDSPNLQGAVSNARMIGLSAKDVSTSVKNLPALPLVGKLNPVSMVKDVGHFFGYKFAPWGAVNIVKNLGTALGVIGALISVYQYFSNQEKEEEARKAIKQTKDDIQNEFSTYAKSVEEGFITASLSRLDEILAPNVKDIEEKLTAFHRQKDRLKKINKELQALLLEINTLIVDVQSTVKV